MASSNKSKRQLRIAFVGAGSIARSQMQALTRRDDVSIVALADPVQAALSECGEEFGVASLHTDYRQMLRHHDVDAVSVCTPNRLHVAPTIAALKAGADVLCEKPLAMTAAEAKRMVRTADTLGRKLVVGFQYRYDPRTQFLRKAVEDGQFGRILYGRVRAMRRRGIPNWGTFGSKAQQGGGPLIDIGVHALEMAHYTMGSPKPVSASADMFTYIGNKPSNEVESAWKGWNYRNYDVEDLAVGRIRFDDGSVIHIEASFAAHIEKDDWNFELMGQRAGCTWQPPAIFSDEAGHMVNKTPGWLSPRTSWREVFDSKMNHFVEHVLYDKPTIAPGADGLAVQQMLYALYRYAENSGSEVKIR